ncbi:winged helix-turn-helix transcriptional regulator [Enterobacteriaceae bacterium EKM102V]|uniref:MarR family winged helix-turn-helix transcriptional regulator n=1 Tax=Pantoea TaxID=53335 RepID=UPI00142DEA85|nr:MULTISPECIES: MarR family winged helix-turn-helix transcriptional regulator [Pantoea]KAF6662935.1 winged helix-turn-helix transcriptional regulator [Enterobacteriaceae bacterium EKM102V]KAF6671402.1 winged helix-turn-helix transcriptional regulator [Pantoea sp. EKM103V]
MSDLTESAALLRMLVGKLSRRLRESAPPGELTWSQVAVLGHLVRDGAMTVTQLAAAEGVRSQSMGSTVAGLLAADLVTGESDPHDGRKTRYLPTAASLAVIASSRAMRDDWLVRTLEARLTPAEQQQLTDVLPLLQRLADHSL